MSNVIYTCPNDGTQHTDPSARFCEYCGGALRYYCVVHGDWLFGAECPKCGGIPFHAPAPPAPAVSAPAASVRVATPLFNPPLTTRAARVVVPPPPAAPAPDIDKKAIVLGIVIFVLTVGALLIVPWTLRDTPPPQIESPPQGPRI